jgi:preprotein translocase subunit SecA
MLNNLRQTVTQVLSHLEIRMQEPTPPPPAMVAQAPTAPPPSSSSGSSRTPAAAAAGAVDLLEIDRDDPSTWGKVPRNAPCPCGSGKKFKQCHGRIG